MATGVKIPIFRAETEEWESYVERVEAYCRLHKTAKKSKVDSLITSLSGSQYRTLNSLVFPKKSIEKSFEELVEVMGKHYMGQRKPRSEKFIFKSLVRAEGESIQTFAVRLREMARHDENLVDQFQAGLNLKEGVRKIVDHSEGLKLSFQTAMDVALEVEEREKGTTSFIQQNTGVHSVAHRTHHATKGEGKKKMLPVQL